VDIKEVIAELRATIEGARSMPMSSSAVINRADVLAMIDRIEAALPESLARSEKVFTDRESVIAEGRAEADRIIVEAEQERDRLVSDTEVYRIAKREAETILADVRKEADGLRREADEYVDGRLANLEITLNRTLEAVSRGRDRLHNRSDLSRLDTAEHDTSPFFAEE
jgi:cell division septum initiation protein DivIVA